MIPEDATSVAKYMYRIKSIVGGDYYFVMKVLPQCFCLFVYPKVFVVDEKCAVLNAKKFVRK